MADASSKAHRQEAAEAEVEGFRKNLGPFVVAADETRMPMVFTDARQADNPLIFANDSFLRLTGYQREEVLGQSFSCLIGEANSPEELAQIKSAFNETPGAHSEHSFRRKDGTEFWATTFISPVREADGETAQYFISFVDLTRHKEEQAHSRMLIDELNHRVKNTLATVQSITWQAFRHSSDLEVIRRSIESRLQALARSHDLLTASDWNGAGLREVIYAALEPFSAENGRMERVVTEGNNVHFPPKATLAFGIAFHELATNAAKYGAFANDKGSIAISWKIQPTSDGKRLILRWQERDGPPVVPPTRHGFGTQVIERGLAHELEGTVTLSYEPEGLACVIDIPLPRDGRVR